MARVTEEGVLSHLAAVCFCGAQIGVPGQYPIFSGNSWGRPENDWLSEPERLYKHGSAIREELR